MCPHLFHLINCQRLMLFITAFVFFVLEGFCCQPPQPNIPCPWATILALYLNSSSAALTIFQKVLSNWKLLTLKVVDFSDCTRTGFTLLTSAAVVQHWIVCTACGCGLHNVFRTQSLDICNTGLYVWVLLFYSAENDMLDFHTKSIHWAKSGHKKG